ncbi:hypothetical protein C7N43_16325 [Sphingobacteriales bacterium UPWRP_1]|nr:hypothetical protein B6N25_02690 [Sphingobacteriales bacterium TSM_CSS]PSJ75961.1 hypothetical protein C7N43_16325 [Sphingobacteriales bacterium UPWRP_1]
MKTNYFFALLAFLSITFWACQPSGKTEENAAAGKNGTEQTEQPAAANPDAMTNNGITLTPVTNSPEFADARLVLKAPADKAMLKDTTVKFDFDVENYQLGSQTPDAGQKMCANSDKGQHLHIILNNEPYLAYYESEFTKGLPEGNYVLLSFLSRSYHESLKHKEAATISTFTVGKPKTKPDFDVNAEHLFYSRPKGEYIGEANIKKILLDFYLLNCTLTPEGKRVLAKINNSSFTLTKWQPYFIEGLPEGETTISLQLIDKDGNVVPGPYNSVTRTIKLHKDEPVIEKK